MGNPFQEAIDGVPGAREAFVEQYTGVIRHGVREIKTEYARAEADTEELANEVYLALFGRDAKTLRDFRGECAPHTFVGAVARRAARYFLRKTAACRVARTATRREQADLDREYAAGDKSTRLSATKDAAASLAAKIAEVCTLRDDDGEAELLLEESNQHAEQAGLSADRPVGQHRDNKVKACLSAMRDDYGKADWSYDRSFDFEVLTRLSKYASGEWKPVNYAKAGTAAKKPRQRSARSYVRQGAGQWTLSNGSRYPRPDQAAMRNEACAIARQRLTPAEHEVVEMAKLQGMSHDDIAKARGCSVQTSKNLLNKAMSKLAAYRRPA